MLLTLRSVRGILLHMVMPVTPRSRFHSLADLSELLPGSEKEPSATRNSPDAALHDGKGKSVRVRLDTKGRKGKTVTMVTGLQHNPETLQDIARILKSHCGAGGTVKEGAIEIQGDHRARITEKLRSMNYVVT